MINRWYHLEKSMFSIILHKRKNFHHIFFALLHLYNTLSNLKIYRWWVIWRSSGKSSTLWFSSSTFTYLIFRGLGNSWAFTWSLGMESPPWAMWFVGFTKFTLPEINMPQKMASQKGNLFQIKFQEQFVSFREGTTSLYLYLCWVFEIKVSFYPRQVIGFFQLLFFSKNISFCCYGTKKLKNRRIGSEISGFVICGWRSWLQCNFSRFGILVSFCSTGWYHLWTWYLQSCEWRGDWCCRRFLAWPRHGGEFCHRPHVLVACLIVLEDVDIREIWSSLWELVGTSEIIAVLGCRTVSCVSAVLGVQRRSTQNVIKSFWNES